MMNSLVFFVNDLRRTAGSYPRERGAWSTGDRCKQLLSSALSPRLSLAREKQLCPASAAGFQQLLLQTFFPDRRIADKTMQRRILQKLRAWHISTGTLPDPESVVKERQARATALRSISFAAMCRVLVQAFLEANAEYVASWKSVRRRTPPALPVSGVGDSAAAAATDRLTAHLDESKKAWSELQDSVRESLPPAEFLKRWAQDKIAVYRETVSEFISGFREETVGLQPSQSQSYAQSATHSTATTSPPPVPSITHPSDAAHAVQQDRGRSGPGEAQDRG